MRKLISAKKASNLLLIVLGLLIVFHLLVIAGLVPSTIVWGNQIEEASILPLELIAIVITISFGLFILIKMRYLADNRPSKVVNIGLWIIAIFLLGNSIANLLSSVSAENFVFAPIAILMGLLTIRLALEK